MLVFRSSKLRAFIDGNGNVRVWGAATDLDPLDATGRVNNDLHNTDSRIKRFARQELLKVEREHVGVVHHGAED
jgi:hypothetical protein